MNVAYKTRRHQIERFARDVRAGRESLAHGLKWAAFVGACEERDHCLEIMRSTISVDRRIVRMLEEEICAKSVLKVLGYDDSKTRNKR